MDSSFPKFLVSLLAALNIVCLASACATQCNTKCITVSLNRWQFGHVGESTFLILCRYALSGTCPDLSWNRILAWFRLRLLVNLENFVMDESGSISAILSDLHQENVKNLIGLI